MGCSISKQPDLCNDLWLEIFRRLPIKSLCRFRCVCKSWRSLFTPDFFIGLESYAPPLHDPPLRDLYNHVPDDSHVRPHITYIHPLDDDEVDREGNCLWLKLIGIIHGVVCLGSSQKLRAIIWNPTTSKYISIKNHKYESYDGCPFDMGFGYDARNHDFKVVMTTLPWYCVFTVGRDSSWRESKANNLKGYITQPECGVCFTNGAIHWIAITKRLIDQFIITYTFALLLFDCESEEFASMELPQQLIPNGPDETDLVQLFTYHDMLSALKKTPSQSGYGLWDDAYDRFFELWVMEEHGVVSSWKKLFKIDKGPSVVNHVVVLGKDGVISQPSVEKLYSYGPPPMEFVNSRPPQPMNGQAFVESWALMDVMQQQQQHRGQDVKADYRRRDAKFYLYGLVLYECAAEARGWYHRLYTGVAIGTTSCLNKQGSICTPKLAPESAGMPIDSSPCSSSISRALQTSVRRTIC